MAIKNRFERQKKRVMSLGGMLASVFLFFWGYNVWSLTQYGYKINGQHLGIQLHELKIFDLFQLSPDDTSFKAEKDRFGWIAYGYRELEDCPPEVVCRRNALIWITPSFEMIEMNIPEDKFVNHKMSHQIGGVGFGAGIDFRFAFPRSNLDIDHQIQGGVLTTNDISADGGSGFSVELNLKTKLKWHKFKMERVFGNSRERNIMSAEDIRNRLKQAFYYPIRVPAVAKYEFMAFMQGDHQPNLNGVLLAKALDGDHKGNIEASLFFDRPVTNTNRAVSSFNVGQFYFSISFHAWKKGPLFDDREAFYDMEPPLAGHIFEGVPIALELKPGLNEITRKGLPIKFKGLGQGVLTYTKKMKASWYRLDRSETKGPIATMDLKPVSPEQLEILAEGYAINRTKYHQEMAYSVDPAPNPFFDAMNEAVKARVKDEACLQILIRPAPRP